MGQIVAARTRPLGRAIRCALANRCRLPGKQRLVGHQVGRYRPSGSVETAASPIADNVPALAEAIVLNYLALHNEVGRFGTVVPGAALGTSAAVLDPLTAFAPLPRFGG